MTKTQAWWQFTKERFDPISHLIMIVVFLLAHILLVKAPIFTFTTLLLFIGVTAFYFKLRLYDEVKDFELDKVINKTRPLPRGLLNIVDMHKGMAVCIFVELLCFGVSGSNALVALSLTIFYSLLMFKEFFIKERIRPLLTTYALSHTIVTTFLSIAIFSFLTQLTFLEIISDFSLLSFALANWLLFNIFEFGRKTFATNEERHNVDTYSSLLGRTGAVMLVASQAAIAHYLSLNLKGLNLTFMLWGFGILLLVLAVLSASYIIKNNESAAKRYRTFSSLYIIAFYLILIIALLMN